MRARAVITADAMGSLILRIVLVFLRTAITSLRASLLTGRRRRSLRNHNLLEARRFELAGSTGN